MIAFLILCTQNGQGIPGKLSSNTKYATGVISNSQITLSIQTKFDLKDKIKININLILYRL